MKYISLIACLMLLGCCQDDQACRLDMQYDACLFGNGAQPDAQKIKACQDVRREEEKR